MFEVARAGCWDVAGADVQRALRFRVPAVISRRCATRDDAVLPSVSRARGAEAVRHGARRATPRGVAAPRHRTIRIEVAVPGSTLARHVVEAAAAVAVPAGAA